MKRSETSAGSVANTEAKARSARSRASGSVTLASFQVSNVCESHSAAWGAFWGASTGTSAAIASILAMNCATSTRAVEETGGIVPV